MLEMRKLEENDESYSRGIQRLALRRTTNQEEICSLMRGVNATKLEGKPR